MRPKVAGGHGSVVAQQEVYRRVKLKGSSGKVQAQRLKLGDPRFKVAQPRGLLAWVAYWPVCLNASPPPAAQIPSG